MRKSTLNLIICILVVVLLGGAAVALFKGINPIETLPGLNPDSTSDNTTTGDKKTETTEIISKGDQNHNHVWNITDTTLTEHIKSCTCGASVAESHDSTVRKVREASYVKSSVSESYCKICNKLLDTIVGPKEEDFQIYLTYEDFVCTVDSGKLTAKYTFPAGYAERIGEVDKFLMFYLDGDISNIHRLQFNSPKLTSLQMSNPTGNNYVSYADGVLTIANIAVSGDNQTTLEAFLPFGVFSVH